MLTFSGKNKSWPRVYSTVTRVGCLQQLQPPTYGNWPAHLLPAAHTLAIIQQHAASMHVTPTAVADIYLCKAHKSDARCAACMTQQTACTLGASTLGETSYANWNRMCCTLLQKIKCMHKHMSDVAHHPSWVVHP